FDQIFCASLVERGQESDCHFGRSSCLPPTIDESRIVDNGWLKARKHPGASLERAVVKKRTVRMNPDGRKSLVSGDQFNFSPRFLLASPGSSSAVLNVMRPPLM